MDFSQVRSGIFTAAVGSEHANVTVIVGDQHSLIVDTGSSPAEGEELRRCIQTITDKPLSTVVLSHAHWDHVFGLGGFADVETIAHESFPMGVLCDENKSHASDVGIDIATIPTPTVFLSLIAVRDLGNLVVEIAHFGPAHTAGDLIIAVPSSHIIIAGDLVETSGPPQFDETSSLSGWGAALDSLYSMLRDDLLVIPGHGPIASPWDVGHMRSGLAGIWDQAEWAYQQGIPVDEVYGYDDLQWPWDKATAQAGIKAAYRELSNE